MNTFSRFVAVLAFSASLGMPLFASAVVDRGTIDACNNQGKIYDSVSQSCVYPPSVTGASGGINTSYLRGYSDSVIGIINDILVPVLIALAFIVFLWGVFTYFIRGAADEKKREEGRQFALWGIIGFVIILSVWGLVAIVGTTLNLSTGSASSNGLRPPTI